MGVKSFFIFSLEKLTSNSTSKKRLRIFPRKMKRARMRKRFSAIVLNSIATLALQLAIISDASVLNLRTFMNEMESMALSVSQEVEKIYADRCNRLSSCDLFTSVNLHLMKPRRSAGRTTSRIAKMLRRRRMWKDL